MPGIRRKPRKQISTSVLIADDEEVVRRQVRTALQDAGFTICGEAVNGYEALEKAMVLQPDVAILDLRMPLLNGIEVAYLLKEKSPASKIILLTVYEIGEVLSDVAGIAATVSKTDGLGKLVDCVRQVANARRTKASE